MSTDPTEPLEAARRANRALAERVSELERELKRFSEGVRVPVPLGTTLAERETLLSEVERLANMGSWVWDVVTDETLWSDGMYRVLGYDPATTKASFEGFFARLHPADLERARAVAVRIRATGVSERTDVRVVHPDGSLRYVTFEAALLHDSAGNVKRAVGAAIDVTAQHEAALALNRTAELLADAQRIGKMGSFEVHLLESKIRWSDELYRIVDVDPSEPPSQELFVQRLHEDDRQRIGRLIERSRADGRTEPSRARIVRRDGSVLHVDMMADSERDAAGNVVSIRGTVTDVTEIVRLEAQFHQSQKMEAVGQLAGGLAHDFNNLLMVISGNVELLLSQHDSPEARQILEAATSATSLTSRLLAFSKQSAQRVRVAQLADDLEVSKHLIQRALGDRITTRYELEPGLWPVRVDSGQIQQVLLNLALNARDAMPDGGTFALVVRNQRLSELDAKRRGERQGEYVKVQVVDTGLGMDEATCARAFEPFFTTKGLGRGTGLGLAMVFGTMKQFGGFVEVHSVPGAGSTFTLWFPRSQEDVTRATSVRPKSGNGSGSVLLVEDNVAVAQVAKLILESLGYSVRLTHDPHEALNLWRSQPADLLVTDVEMPGMSGVLLRERLAEHDPELRTLFITGHSNEQLAAQPRSAALMKPFRRTDLQRALSELRKI
jgi:two-component system cell cycle sensor histidine kinase/response regulator CckA